MPRAPLLTQACPLMEAGQQQQQWHQRPILTPTEAHGQAEHLTGCLSQHLSPESQSLDCRLGDGGVCFWYFLPAPPRCPLSPNNWLDRFGAESAGPTDLAPQGGV